MICNLCGSSEHELLFSNARKESARFSEQPLDVLICKSCGLVMLDFSELTAEKLGEYYSTFNHFQRPGKMVEEHQAIRVRQVEWVVEHLPQDHDVHAVLDVGCGAGFSLHQFKERGFGVFGVDYSPLMIKELKSTYDIDGVAGPFSPKMLNRTYDLLISFHTLEHMMNPNQTIADMAQVISDDGFICIEVPDSQYPRGDQLPDFYCFDHLFHFTECTLGHMLEGHGFEILAAAHIDNASDSGTPMTVLRMLGRKTDSGKQNYAKRNDYESQRTVMLNYRQDHESVVGRIQQTLDEVRVKTNGAPVAIYPGGEHTSLLFAKCSFEGLNLACIFDADEAVVGKHLNGLRIRHSSELPDTDIRHFILSTTNHEKPIASHLKNILPDCHVYGLYHDFD